VDIGYKKRSFIEKLKNNSCRCKLFIVILHWKNKKTFHMYAGYKIEAWD
jgi:hypothetical protein